MNSNEETKKAEYDLIMRIKADLSAFEEVYDKYMEPVYGYIYFRIGNKHEAEDLTSQVFEKALKNVKNFKWQGYSISAWLFTIARNLIIDTYKSSKTSNKIQNIDYAPEVVSDDDTELTVLNQITVEEIDKALKTLSKDYQEVIYLRFVKELTIEETTKVTGKSIDAIKSMTKRAVAALRSIFINNAK